MIKRCSVWNRPEADGDHLNINWCICEMRKFFIDCCAATSPMSLWEKYVEVTQPEGSEFFGYSLDAFNDAITGGGPGWPGECEIYFTNTLQIQKFCGKRFYEGLQRIANESTSARIYLDSPVEPIVTAKRQWWKIWS